MRRPWRIALISVAAVIAVLVLAGVITVYVLLQPERFTQMLQGQAREAGLELSLSQPASPSLFPRPALELKGITLSAEGATAPIMLAARGRLVLPWRTLFRGPTVISQLEIDAPRLDLTALQAWLAQLPASSASPAPALPRISAGVVIRDGSLVRGNSLLLDKLNLQSGPLQPDHVFSLGLDALDAARDPVQLRLLTTPVVAASSLQLQDINLHAAHGSGTVLDLRGQASWRGGADASASLAGQLDQADAGRYQVALELTPATHDAPLLLSLKLDGPGNHVNLALPPLGLVAWWSSLDDPARPQPSMPPATGSIEAGSLDLGGFSVQGLSVQFGADVAAPAAAGSAPAPPSSAGRGS